MDIRTIQEARDLIRKYVPTSRLLRAQSLKEVSGAEVYLKLENEGPTSSFKARGAIYSLRRRLQYGRIAGVVTASSGNHGIATAFAARQMGVPATIFLPVNPGPVKRARIVQQGAQVIEAGRFLEESREHATRYATQHRWYNLVDGQTEGLAIGAGTLGCEIVEQVPRVDAIYVPVGDSSLIRGLAFAVKQMKADVRVVGVQAERAADLGAGGRPKLSRDGERHANECGYHRTLEKALRAGSVSRPGRPTSGQQTSHRHACGAGARGAARATAAERWKHALVVP